MWIKYLNFIYKIVLIYTVFTSPSEDLFIAFCYRQQSYGNDHNYTRIWIAEWTGSQLRMLVPV